jgi:hypothetical protein
MSNFPTVMNPSDLAGQLANSQVQETSGLAGFSFLKMDFESGEWFCGMEGDDVTGDAILVNTATIQHGWILWSNNRPNKVFTGFSQPLPPPMDPIGEDRPSEARSFQAALCDDGEPVSFDSNSYGGRKGVDVLLGKIKAKSASGSQHLYPRVTLTSESYTNSKRGGKLTYNPVFEITAWCDQDGVVETEVQLQLELDATGDPVAKTPAEQPTEQPKRQRRKRKDAA